MIKSRITPAENVGWVGELKSGCWVLFRNSEGDFGEDGRIIYCKKWDVKHLVVCTGFTSCTFYFSRWLFILKRRHCMYL